MLRWLVKVALIQLLMCNETLLCINVVGAFVSDETPFILEKNSFSEKKWSS